MTLVDFLRFGAMFIIFSVAWRVATMRLIDTRVGPAMAVIH